MRNKRGSIKTKIGLKYCGGCNPRYDRVLAAEYLKHELQGLVSFVSYEDPEVLLILIIAGCETACVDRSNFGSTRYRIIDSQEDAEQIARELKEHLI